MKYFQYILFGFISAFSFIACSNAHSKEHASTVKELKASDIIKKINKGENVALTNAIIYGDLNFTDCENNAVSLTNLLTVDIPVHIFFQDCVFMDNVTTVETMKNKNGKPIEMTKHVSFGSDVCFYGCDFRKELNFNESIVNGNLVFTNSIFHDKTTFNHILVNGTQSQFININANGRFSFVYNTIRGNVNFMDAHFAENVSFSGLQVQDLLLNNAEFAKRFELSNATLLGILQFNYGKCGDEAQFSFSKFMDRVSINQTNFEDDFSIEGSSFFGKTKLNRSTFKKNINTANALFYSTPEMNEIMKNDSVSVMVEVKTSAVVPMNY